MTDLRERRMARLRAARVYLVTDDRLDEANLLAKLERALEAGTRVVQFRAKLAGRRELLRQARSLQRVCERYGALYIVNDAVDIAAAIAADGVHLGQDDLPAAAARRLVGDEMLIGLSVSHVPEALTAVEEGAVDYLGVGAMYPTNTKNDAEYGGPELLRAVRSAVDLPLVAIGGISEQNVGEVWAAGADLVAVVSAVFSADDPAEAVRALQRSAPPLA
jgi:thiamine-phosphate pyrophosphorylase